jgi:hemerythrin superfamily protein
MPNRIENIASKAVGKLKSAKASVEGLSGVFRKLAQEHGEVAALLMRVKHSSDPGVRSTLFTTIRKELLAHEKSELKAVYPVLMENADTQQIATHHNQEAAQLEQMIAELTALDVGDAGWQTKFEALADTVQHHAKEEEEQFFPQAQRVLGEAVADALLPRYENAKAEITSQLN